MTQNTIIAIGSWGIVIYLLWNIRRLDMTRQALQGITVHPASWLGRIVYLIIGVTLASAVFVGSALADGADPFNHVQNVIRVVIQTEVPQVIQTPTATATVYLPTPTGTPIPTSTPIPIQTPTLNAVLPSPTTLLQTPSPSDDDKDKTPGWMKTPNGQGQGQFQTPPGQQDKPTKEPNQPKPTNDKPNNDKSNNGNGSSKK